MSRFGEVFETDKSVLSTEMIEPQVNDKVVIALTDLFQDLIDDIKGFGILSSSEIALSLIHI